MREFFKMFFASLLAIIISGIILVGLTITLIVSISKSITEKELKKTRGNVITIDLSKHFHEQGESNSLAILSNGSAYQAGLFDVTRALHHAKTDDGINGIVLLLNDSPNGWATLQQLRAAIADFKTSGKFVYAYGEDIPQNAYFVGSAADSIYLNPAGSMSLKGFATVLAFFKGTLDKLELEPEIYYAGKFKSATEPFRAEKISDPNRLQIEAYQKSMWNEFLIAASQYTQKSKDEINQLAQSGAIQFPQDALRYKLVAGLQYWDQVERRIRRSLHMSDNSEIRYVTLNDYASDERGDGNVSDQEVAVIFAEGAIVDGEQRDEREIASKTFCEEIRKVAANEKVKSVVLRVNSPGGSALASEVILRELDLLRTKKHLVVSMGDFAASGGYFISSMADSIFAQPNTITGSIGVFSMLFSIDKLMKNKLGITFDEVKNAPYADFPTAARPLTTEEAERMQASVDSIYSLFKNHVARGRRLSNADVDSIAQGRVWTGRDAVGIGLVDGLGGLERAIKSAARIAGIKDYKVVTYPEPADKLNTIMKRLNANTEAGAAMKAAIREEIGDHFSWYEQVRELKGMNGKALMAMPYVPVIN